jgi:hypothetical protein
MGEFKSPRHLAQVISNINGDIRLTPNEKVDAVTLAEAQLKALNNGTEDKPSTWDGQCATRMLALTNDAVAMDISAGGSLGNVCAVRALQRNIARQMSCNQAEAERLVELALKPSSRLSRDERAELQEMKNQVRLRSSQVWLFQHDDSPSDPYENVDLGRLPCALGLPYAQDETFVAFVVPVAAINAAVRPCVYDPGWDFQELWRPHGKTRPICANLPAVDGFAEWLAEPPALGSITEAWRGAQVTDCPPSGSHQYD